MKAASFAFSSQNASCVLLVRVSIQILFRASPVALAVKNQPTNAGDIRDEDLIPRLGRSLWKRAWQPTPVFLPEKSHGQRSLVGYSPESHKESDTTEATQHAHEILFIMARQWMLQIGETSKLVNFQKAPKLKSCSIVAYEKYYAYVTTNLKNSLSLREKNKNCLGKFYLWSQLPFKEP